MSSPDRTRDPNLAVLTAWIEATAPFPQLRAWLDHGALLGIVRSGELIPWDDDLDFGAWYHEWVPVRDAVIDSLEDRGLIVFDRDLSLSVFPREEGSALKVTLRLFHRQRECATGEFYLQHARQGTDTWQHRGVTVRGNLYRGARGLLAAARLHPFILRDLTPLPGAARREALAGRVRGTPYAHRVRQLERTAELGRARARGIVPIEMPARYFHNMEQIDWFGFPFLFPSPSDEYLAFKYGPNWRTPVRQWDYLVEDGAVKAKSEGAK